MMSLPWAALPDAAPAARLSGYYLIVGATGAIGEAAARAINAAGGQCVLLGRKVDALEALADALEADGGEPLLYPLDLEGASVDDYNQLADTLSAECAPLKGVVLSAYAGGTLRPFAQLDPERWARETQVNLHAPTLLLRSLWPLLQQSVPSRVLFAQDDLNTVSGANWVHHSVLQWARFGLMQNLAAEGRAAQVQVAGFCPGPRRSNLRACLFGGELPTEVPEATAVGWAIAECLAQEANDFPTAKLIDLRQRV